MLVGVLLLGAGAPGLHGSPWWVAYEADDGRLPEEVGPWKRNWGNWQGQYQGPGAYRTIKDGILTYDSLYDKGVFDFSYIKRPGAMDPGPREFFLAEWRVNVLRVTDQGDPSTTIASDDAWVVGFWFGEDRVFSIFEGYLQIPITAHVMHSYRLVSSDMRQYQLYIDGLLARAGGFSKRVGPSQVGWGDGTQGSGSLHEWDYYRVGVVPEARTAASFLLTVALMGGRGAGPGRTVASSARRFKHG